MQLFIQIHRCFLRTASKSNCILTISVFLLLCRPQFISGQSDGASTQLFIEAYQPIITGGLNEIYNDEWALSAANYTNGTYNRSYFSNAFGLGANQLFSDELVAQLRVGITVRTMEESRTKPERYFNGTHDLIFEDHYKYRQNHLNFFGGIAKRFSTGYRVNLLIGAELTYVHYFNGSADYHSRLQYLDVNESEAWGEDEYWSQKDFANANLIGIGPMIRLEIDCTNHLSFGFQPQMFYCYVWSRGNSVLESRNRIWKDADHNAGVYYLNEVNYKNTTRFNFRQSGWTSISPLLSINWKF
jgi:hypothetical protein